MKSLTEVLGYWIPINLTIIKSVDMQNAPLQHQIQRFYLQKEQRMSSLIDASCNL